MLSRIRKKNLEKMSWERHKNSNIWNENNSLETNLLEQINVMEYSIASEFNCKIITLKEWETGFTEELHRNFTSYRLGRSQKTVSNTIRAVLFIWEAFYKGFHDQCFFHGEMSQSKHWQIFRKNLQRKRFNLKKYRSVMSFLGRFGALKKPRELNSIP